jgi:zinc D-Ala-D-Ala carboxypeptidase
VPQSTPLHRNRAFVFGPPIVLGIVGSLLLFQTAFAGPRLDLVEQKNQSIAESEKPIERASIASHAFTRMQLDNPSSVFVIVNKQRPITPANFVPGDLVEITSSKTLDNPRGHSLSLPAANALIAMALEMQKQGQGQMTLNSGFRSFNTQQALFEGVVKSQGETQALLKAAKPSFSEHQTGLAADISFPAQGCAVMTCFGGTKAGKWISENSWKFGFIVRYQLGTEDTTGYSYEPWHLRYVGLEVAKLYAENGMKTLEEFWGLPAAPNYFPEIAASTND